MRAKAQNKTAAYYNAFKVHITKKASRKSCHSALLTYAAIKNSRSFVKGEVEEEGDCCYRVALKTKKKARSIEVWVYRALANVLKKKKIEAEGGIRGRVLGFRRICVKDSVRAGLDL